MRLRNNDPLAMASLEAVRSEASPSAGMIDSQLENTTHTGGPRSYDAGNKTTGRKRQIATDTLGNLTGFLEYRADIQGRDGPAELSRRSGTAIRGHATSSSSSKPRHRPIAAAGSSSAFKQPSPIYGNGACR